MEFNKPNPLIMSGNLAENFRTFRQSVQIYFDATESHLKRPATQVAIILNLLGPEALKIYNTLRPKENTVIEVLRALEEYCIPRRNQTMELYKFFTRKQLEGENFDKFYSDLRDQAKSCELGDCEDKLVKSQIILGVADRDLQAQLLREDLSLEKVVRHCKAKEQMEINRKLVQDEVKLVYNVEDGQKKHQNTKGRHFEQRTTQTGSGKGWSSKTQSNQYSSSDRVSSKNNCNKPNVKGVNYINDCNRCGKSHKVRECPAYKKNCSNCGLLNHFKNKCRSGKSKIENQVDNLEMEFSIDTLEVKIMNTELECGEIKKSWIDYIKMNGVEQKIKLDTGAEINVMSYKLFKQFNGLNLNKSNVIIKSFGSYTTNSKGNTLFELEHKGKKIKRVFEVVDYDGLPLLSFEACLTLNYKLSEVNELNILNKQSEKEKFIQKNKEIFEGIGKFPDRIKIKLKNNPNPVCNPPRRVPIKIFNKLREQLNLMVKLELIETCSEPSEWQSNLVVVEKPDGTLRICLDPKDINANILREMYQIPTLEEIRPALANKKFYSLLDLKDGFYHCELDEVSSKICTFSSPFGSYKFKRLPFGLSVASEIFQKLMVKYFGEIAGVQIYFDDNIINILY